jgi:hypothetical protein
MNEFNTIPSAPCKLYAEINQSLSFSMTVKNTAGVSIDMRTGYAADFYILADESTELADALIHKTQADGITLGNGTITGLIAAAEMDLNPTTYYHRLIITPTGGIDRPYIEGTLDARYGQKKNAGQANDLALVVNSQPTINLVLSITTGYTQSEVNALLLAKVSFESGTAAAMAARKIVLLAAGTTSVIAYKNTTDLQVYWWNGSDWL